jgi:hypothetical protein
MHSGVYLCPCCAAHLRVPPELHSFRCNTCDALLVHMNRGGVRGLAQVPEADGPLVPYSVSSQRAGLKPQFDTAGLVNSRTRQQYHRALHVESFWRFVMFCAAVPLVIGPGVMLFGWLGLVADDPKWADESLVVLLFAALVWVCCGYVARYAHQRLQFAKAGVRLWESRLHE